MKGCAWWTIKNFNNIVIGEFSAQDAADYIN